MRDGFERALAAGTNLAFMGSNDAYWTCATTTRPDDLHLQVDVRPESGSNAEDGDVPGDWPAGMACSGVQHAISASSTNRSNYTVTAAGAADP